jgi:hypothetical protein
MDYYLHHDGQNLGVFPLDELRRRRAAGELSGDEFVWREGMAAWASLDSVLGTSSPGAPASAPAPPTAAAARKGKSNHLLVWGIVVAAALVVGGVATVGLMAVKFAGRVRQAVQGAGERNSTDSAEVAGREVIVSTNSLTEAVVRKRGRAFRVRQYVEGYRKNGQHGAAWDSEAAQLMESWITANYGGPTNLPSPQTLSDKLAALAGCNDPLVLTVAAANAVELHEKLRRLERAVTGFEQSRYQAYPKFYAAVTLAADLGSQSLRVRPLDQAAARYFNQAFTDGSFQPGDEEELAEILVNGWAHSFFGRNGAAVCQAARKAKGYPWLALVLEGEQEINEAWKARGTGWADSVSNRGWQDFADHLAKARTALSQAWKQQPGRPLAPTRMITVAMGGTGAEEMRTWFDRAVEAQIDYPQAWSQMRWGLRPRWHGSEEAMLALGIRAVDTKRFDTDVPRKLMDFISDVEAELEQPPGEHIYGRSDVWPHLKEMYEGYVAEPSLKPWQDGWRSCYAAVAYLAGEYETAREQLEAVNWKPAREKLTAWGTDLSLMPLKVAALTGKSGEQVSRAESKYSEGDLAAPAKLYAELSSAPETDERTREYSRCRLAALKQEQQLAKGEWIDLLPADEKDPNWEFAGDKVRRLADGAVEVESGVRGHGFYCRTRVGPEFEVTGEFELAHSSTKDFQAGVLMGLPDSPRSDWYSFRMKRSAVEGQIASFSWGFTTQQIARRAKLNEGRNTFRFRLQGGQADAWVNGTQVLEQAAPAKTLRLYSGCMLGLGAYNDMNETVIRYRNVKARRL